VGTGDGVIGNNIKTDSMKKLYALVVLLMVGMTACKKDTTHYAATGTITRIDMGACACCGGYVLSMTGSDSTYRFFSFPAGTTFDTTTFPISVSFNYAITGRCDEDFIYLKITSMARD
jgi:hypothetical protein